MAEELKIGDIVVIKTLMQVNAYKPEMVIEEVLDNNVVSCIWYVPTEHQYKKQEFNMLSLEKRR